MIYFDDVTSTHSTSSQNCIQHVRPYTELASDLQNNTVARYNFITPNLCDDMHNSTGCATSDESEGGDFPIGMIVLSPKVKAPGYSNTIPYNHGSTLRSAQEIFGVTPLLGGAATSTDLARPRASCSKARRTSRRCSAAPQRRPTCPTCSCRSRRHPGRRRCQARRSIAAR
jgi:hypothetical protein